MTSILRYPLEVTGFQSFKLPTGHKILSVAPCHGQDDGQYTIDLWAKVSPSDTESTVVVYILGTGHPYPTYKSTAADLPLTFRGTCVMNDGLVWHVFTGEVNK